MLTVESLKAYGANIEEGLGRCFGTESFYLRLVGMGLNDKNFGILKAAVEAGDTNAAFEAAHALKGSTGNLALTPIYQPICELTEKLRGQAGPVDMSDLPQRIFDALERAKQLLD